jgi:ectoine hydroxylase-related dioxygenase (phytanoyl-CoA dioxygenase family)
MRLTAGEREQYERDGYLVRRNVFSADEIEAMGSAIERVCAQLVARKDRSGKKVQVSSFSVFEQFWAESVVIKWEPSDPNRLKGLEPFAHLDPYLTEVAKHRGFIEPMRDLVGCEDVALFTEKLNLKRASGGGGFAPHRDFPYWEQPAEQPERLVTAWVALDDADAENGALEVLPGSHLLEAVPHRKSEKLFESFEVDTERFDTSAMRTVRARAGDVVFFGPFLVHRSANNRSTRDRRALLYTYQPAGLRTQLENMCRWAEAARRNP